MENLKDGGPAYPIPLNVGEPVPTKMCVADGMTMRQYYKAAALTGMLASPNRRVKATREAYTLLSEDAGDIADSMIEEDKNYAKSPE